MKTQVMSISEFLHGRKEEPFSAKVERHFNKYGMVYKVAGVTVIFLLSGSSALAAGSIDVEARKLYIELVKIGKWVIIFKGAIDIIKALGDGDNASAKKTFITSLLTFLILLGLPYGMDKIGEIFNNISATTTTAPGGWE